MMALKMEEQGYDIYNINDPFYRDYCTPYKSSENTDVLLSDRVDHIYNNEDAKCQGGCKFNNYIVGTRFINCTCDAESNEEENLEKKIDKMDPKTFSQSFYYVLKYSNYKILKCYKLVFTKNSFTKNKGGIIIFILFILYLLSMLWHIFQGLKPLKKSVGFFVEENEKEGIIVLYKMSLFFPPKKRKSALKGKKEKLGTKETEVLNTQKSTKFAIENENFEKRINTQSQFHEKTEKSEKAKNKEKIKFKTYSVKEATIKSKSTHHKSGKRKLKRKESENEIVNANEENQIKTLDDFELNELEYEDAVKFDKRSWWCMYYYLIKREHRIIFTFFVCRDYNLVPVKLSRFWFLLATDMCMNVFFFSDATMHKIYLNYGKYDFVQQIPQIIYSSIISQIIEVFLCFLSLTDKHMYEIKNLEPGKRNKDEVVRVYDTINKKLFFYFLITFIFFLGYWYIVCVFCAVYENTQITYIKDSFISSLLGYIYPFILYLFPAAFRGCALKSKNNKCLYKLSEIIPFF